MESSAPSVARRRREVFASYAEAHAEAHRSL